MRNGLKCEEGFKWFQLEGLFSLRINAVHLVGGVKCVLSRLVVHL